MLVPHLQSDLKLSLTLSTAVGCPLIQRTLWVILKQTFTNLSPTTVSVLTFLYISKQNKTHAKHEGHDGPTWLT